jgi:hypothetical protein
VPGSQAARQPGNWDCGLLWSYRHAPPRPKAVRFPPAIARVLPTLVSQLPSAPSHQSHAAAGAAPSDAAHPLPSPPAFRRTSTLPPNLLLLLLLLLPGQTDPHRHYYHHRHQQLPLPLCLKSADSPGQASRPPCPSLAPPPQHAARRPVHPWPRGLQALRASPLHRARICSSVATTVHHQHQGSTPITHTTHNLQRRKNGAKGGVAPKCVCAQLDVHIGSKAIDTYLIVFACRAHCARVRRQSRCCCTLSMPLTILILAVRDLPPRLAREAQCS